MASDLTVTFGKHKGHPLDVFREDVGYITWLSTPPQAGWWKDTWEFKAIWALDHNEPVPPKPKVRAILEPEYDLATERPAKVRKITHRQYGDKTLLFECPNCGDNCADEINTPTASTMRRVRCRMCGQHAKIGIKRAQTNWAVAFWSYDCPAWNGKTQQDYERACANCPQQKGALSDHTKCGCTKDFACACVQ